MRWSEILENNINGIAVTNLNDFLKKGISDKKQNDIDIQDAEETFQDLEEADFGAGASFRNASDEEMQSYLDKVKNSTLSPSEKFKLPQFHRKNIPIKDEKGHDYDLDALKKSIMQRPRQLLSQNGKMVHSTGSKTVFYNLGLPALRGLAVNEATGKFVIVDTCPGAGACKIYCYARKGSYIQFAAVGIAQTRVLNFLMNDPEGFQEVLGAEILIASMKNRGKADIIIRYHDSGDFFSPAYLNLAISIAKRFPKIKFYAYTKTASVINADRPPNFVINFSEGALPSETKKVNLKKAKHSFVVPRELFYDLLNMVGRSFVKDEHGQNTFKSPEAILELRKRISQKYDVPLKTLIMYNQMKLIPDKGIPKWDVIVPPGAGDEAATRNDVKGIFLLFH